MKKVTLLGQKHKIYKEGLNMNENNKNLFPSNLMYGHAYTPNQMMNRIFSPEVGLREGTMFPELVSPYVSCQSIRVIETLKEGGI